MDGSIYIQIKQGITEEGILPEDFSLKTETAEESIPWAPGAQDGVTIYHINYPGLNDEEYTKMEEALKSASAGDSAAAGRLFSELTKNVRAVSIVDELQGYIFENKDDIDAKNLFWTAVTLVKESLNPECLKIGMELLELFKHPSDIREIIRTVGLYDEFTIFSVWCMMNWEDGNRDIFELAKKVRGWGRVHAVEKLKPENEEIRQWLLTEGCRNEVLPAYSALTCWEKAGAESILFGTPTVEEFKGLSLIIGGLLDEGPITGISETDDPVGIINRFLEISGNYPLTDADRGVIASARDYIDGNKT
ncbi:MAG: hypothetical protein IKE27_00555 [Oscillospiraceae bacterium]|nr:hypothetical protein [Oscillospiraceae bacterium]